ncbi:MAG: ABC transporter permease [Hungatella sp.]|jgi:ribose transport system permease protein|nr:ABC transporter permease [Hungatella sp.]
MNTTRAAKPHEAIGKTLTIKKIIGKMGALLALIVLCLLIGIATRGRFFATSNLMNVLRQVSINCFIAAGMLLVLITAGIDLSVGFNAVLATCVMGVMVKGGFTFSPVLILVALVIAGIVGYVNGTLLTRLSLPHPFVSTLGMKFVTWGLALIVTSATPIGLSGKGVDGMLWLGSAAVPGTKAIGRLPMSFVAVVVLYVIMHIFLTRTELGRKIYCVGGNPEASRLSGIDCDKVLRIVYTMSGLLCGLAGIVLAGRVATADPNAGATFDTDAIAACIVGGASFTGGKGSMGGTLVGAMIIAVIRNGLNLLGASTDVQYVVIGLVIILAVLIDVMRAKAEANARKQAMIK